MSPFEYDTPLANASLKRIALPVPLCRGCPLGSEEAEEEELRGLVHGLLEERAKGKGFTPFISGIDAKEFAALLQFRRSLLVEGQY